MKSKNVGIGTIETPQEKKEQLVNKLDRGLEEKGTECRRRYESKEECLKHIPLYEKADKCKLCKRGGKL